MKKIILLLLAIISVLQVSAQETESPQNGSTISIDSLSVRLTKLQHDYDFLYCDYELYKLTKDLDGLSKSIDIAANGVIINLYHSRFDRALYKSYLNDYDSSCGLFDALKDKIDVVSRSIAIRILSSDLSDTEIQLIKNNLGVIQASTNKVEKALAYYDTAINAYSSMR